MNSIMKIILMIGLFLSFSVLNTVQGSVINTSNKCILLVDQELIFLSNSNCISGEAECSCAEGQCCSAGGGNCACTSCDDDVDNDNDDDDDDGYDWVEVVLDIGTAIIPYL